MEIEVYPNLLPFKLNEIKMSGRKETKVQQVTSWLNHSVKMDATSVNREYTSNYCIRTLPNTDAHA